MAANDLGTIVGAGRLAWPYGFDGCPASKPVCELAMYDVDLQIQADGALAVAETQAMMFTGTYQQGYRLVPLDRATGASNVSAPKSPNGQTLAYIRKTGQLNTLSWVRSHIAVLGGVSRAAECRSCDGDDGKS
jgi:hypothetical protein